MYTARYLYETFCTCVFASRTPLCFASGISVFVLHVVACRVVSRRAVLCMPQEDYECTAKSVEISTWNFYISRLYLWFPQITLQLIHSLYYNAGGILWNDSFVEYVHREFEKLLRDIFVHVIDKIRGFNNDRSIGSYWLFLNLSLSVNVRHCILFALLPVSVTNY